MDIKEAIEILKELAYNMLQDYIYDKSEITEYDKKINLAIETLLTAYEKEKEKNKKLKSEISDLKWKYSKF